MAEYKLTNKAVEDLSNIWDYTVKFWSEKQADKYYNELIFACQETAENPEHGRSYEEISDQLLGTKINQHIIFFRKLNDECIEIIRILHQRMDLKTRVTG